MPIPSLEPEERLPFFCAAAASACAASGALVSRAAADTLFLDSFGTHSLALMYMGTSVLVGSLAYCFARYLSRLSLSRVLILACAFLGMAALALRVALIFPWRGTRVIAYFWGDLTVNGAMLMFWSFFGQIFDFRRAKKLMGAVGAAGTVTCIAVGFLIRPFTRLFGTPNLLVVVAFLMAGLAASVFYLTSRGGALLDGAKPATASDAHLPGLGQHFRMLERPQIRSLALQAMIATMVIILVDFQFKATAQAHFRGPHLASFFGEFYAVTNVLVLLIQLFALHYLLRGQTLLASLCILPAGLFLGGAATILTASFAAVLVTKLISQTCLFTTDGGAFQILYLGIKKQTRPQARALIDGICKPAAIGITGAALVVLSGILKVYFLAIPAVALCLIWFWLARRNYSLYLSGLIDALSARMLDLSEDSQGLRDKTVELYTRKALVAAKPEEIPHLLSIIEQMDDLDWSSEIRTMLRRPEPEVKIAALDYVSRWGKPVDLSDIAAIVSHPVPEVRRAAVRAVSLSGEQVLVPLRESLEDPDPGVRAEAASALIDIGHFGGLVKGAVAVQSMIESEDTAYRIALASPISRLHARGRTELLLNLLSDPDVEVRLAALKASANTPEKDLVPVIIPQLEKARTSGMAAEALISLGPLTPEYLSSISDDAELARTFERYVYLPVILERIASPAALQVLQRVLEVTGARAATPTVRAYCQILQRQPTFHPYREGWESVLRTQVQALMKRKSLLGRSVALAGAAFLRTALEEECTIRLSDVLALIGVQAPLVKMDAIGRQLVQGDEDQRGRAREVLEHVIPVSWRGEVLDAIDFKPSASAAGSLEAVLREVVEADYSEGILLGALYAAANDGSPAVVALVRRCMENPSQSVRETAQFALEKTETPADSVTGGVKGANSMIVVERILFLRRVPLFSCMATAELTQVASIAREVTYPAGSRIIQEGEHGDHMFLIVEGEVLIQRGQTPVKTLGAKDFFGEMSIIDGEPRSASAVAQKDCLLLRIDKADFDELLATYNSMAISVVRALNQRLRDVLPALQRV